MSQRQSRIAWGIILGMCGFACIGLTLAQVPAGKAVAVETLLPANSIVYVGATGKDAQKEAWEQTAAHDALYKTGLMAVIEKTLTSLGAQAPQDEQMKALQKAGEYVQNKGFSVAIALPNPAAGGPPIPSVTVVLHEGAVLEAGLNEMLKENAPPDIQINEQTIEGRKVTSIPIPDVPLPIEVSWWSEGPHLVITAGIGAAQTAINVATGKSPNITADPNWKKYNAGNADFDVAFVGWFDFGSLRKQFGEIQIPLPPIGGGFGPPVPETAPADEAASADEGDSEAAFGPLRADQVALLQQGPKLIKINDVLKALGLDTVGSIVSRSGFKGRALWSETTLEAPGPRRGLLAYWDQKPITLNDLPPLPFGHTGFYACSVDWSKFYDTTVTLVRDVAKLGPEEIAVQVEGGVQNLPLIIGFDPKVELFDPLGNVFCCYSDTRQGILGLGAGVVIQVDDADTLRQTVMNLIGMATEQLSAEELTITTTKKQGRDIVTLQIAGGMFNPSFAIDDDWLAIGLFPQTVEAFYLRVDGKLTNWKPTRSYEQSLAAMPQEFTSISASDPRKGVRFLMGLAPMLMPAINAGIKEFGIPGTEGLQIEFSVADLPPAELVARPLFPNVSTCTADENGLKWTSRNSLPSIPFVGSVTGLATVGVVVALLLPAIQQARGAARRSVSINNLKQMGLALHNYHDVHRSFPQGTHPNEDLKPEKRLSWQANILPYLDQAPLYQQIDFDEAWDSDANKGLMNTKLQVFQNPGTKVEKEPKHGTTHYVGIAGIGKNAASLPITDKNAGVFGYNRKTGLRDITDGSSNTLMVSEASKSFGAWGAGGVGTIRGFVKKPYINGPDGIGGPSRGGCNMLFCDGAVRFISENIDPTVLENLARMHDGNVIPAF
jgi:prepilin-type processing-associated H-X9-DG protein